MVDLKITVDQLKNYLGTSLRVVESETITRELVGIHNDQPILHDYGYTVIKNIQPICYRLSDLDKEIEHNGERFVPMNVMDLQKCNYDKSGYECDLTVGGTTLSWGLHGMIDYINQLYEWHFWPFGDEYFEQGLVIDKRKEASNG